MATNKVFVNYTETYDLNTVKDKLTVLGIHTPTKASLIKVCSGLFQNFKAMKIHSCDVVLGCASQLPMDPLGIGTEPGMVAPQDVMNPILFKPVTGEKLNAILESVYLQNNADVNSISERKLGHSNAYYTLLSDNSFRKCHPQMGLIANGLVPLVHNLATLRPITGKAYNLSVENDSGLPQIDYSTTGNGATHGFGDEYMKDISESGTSYVSAHTGTSFISTGAIPLPSFPTVITLPTGTPDNPSTTGNIPMIPKVYCGVIVMPPAILQSLYYRIQVTWHIGFYGFRPSFDAFGIANIVNSDGLYTERYEAPVTTATASMMDIEDGSVDGFGVQNINAVNVSVA